MPAFAHLARMRRAAEMYAALLVPYTDRGAPRCSLQDNNRLQWLLGLCHCSLSVHRDCAADCTVCSQDLIRADHI